MSKFSEAAQAGGILRNQFKATLALLDFVQELGDLDQAKEAAENALKEVIQRKVKVEEDLAQTQTQLNDAVVRLNDAVAQVQSVKSSADDYALQTRADAELQAKEIVEVANVQKVDADLRDAALTQHEAELVLRDTALTEREAEVARKLAKHERKAAKLKAATAEDDAD